MSEVGAFLLGSMAGCAAGIVLVALLFIAKRED